MKRQARRRGATACLSLLLSASLAACSGRHESVTPESDNRTAGDKVTVNLSMTLPYAPLMLALDEGFFEQEGIAIEPAWLDYSSAQAALASGQLDVLSTPIRASVFSMIERGVPMQLVVGKGHESEGCSAETFVAPTAMAERIAAAGGSPKGERIAVVRGGNQEYLLARYLARYQLTFEDVIAFPLPHGTPGSSSEGIEALKYVGEPNLSILLSRGGTSVVVTADEIVPRHQTTFVVYGKRLLHDDPELGRRFMRAYVRGLRRLDEGATDRNVEILSRSTRLSPEIIRGMCWTSTRNDGRIDPADVQPFLDWALSVGYLDGPMTVEWWNPAFLDHAIESLAKDPR